MSAGTAPKRIAVERAQTGLHQNQPEWQGLNPADNNFIAFHELPFHELIKRNRQSLSGKI